MISAALRRWSSRSENAVLSQDFAPRSAEDLRATESFVRWGLTQLGLSWTEADGVYRVALPTEQQAAWDDRGELCLTFDPECYASQRSAGVAWMAPGAELFSDFIAALRRQGEVVHCRPARGPRSVHQLSERLFDAYQVEGGHVRLAGCRLEDRPFLRLTYGGAETPLRHYCFDPDAREADPALLAALGLFDLAAYDQRPPRLPGGELEQLVAASEVGVPADPADLLVRTVAWTKYAEGKLQFTIGDAAVELPFSDWAATLTAPPFVCSATGKATYHLAALDDGRIVAAEEVAVCGESGRRALRGELCECSETGRRVLPEFGATCPVSGKFLLHALLATCPTCRQAVSPAVLRKHGCAGCESVQTVAKDDPRMARILGEHPGLDRWRKWKLAETETAYIAEARTLFKRLLVVLDKQTLEPLHLAAASRYLGRWSELSETLRDEMLRSA